jgi:uncharacterized membrane protein YbhN (UPF0104 family)
MNIPPRITRILKTALPFLFYALLLVFLALYLQTINWQALRNVEISWGYFVIATIFALVTRYFGAYIWFVILKSLGAGDIHNKVQLIFVYAKSWLGRYIPGTAPWILGKIYFASQHGVSKNKLAVSSLLEGALQIAVLMALSVVMLAFDHRLDVVDGRLKLVMIIILAGCIVAMIPRVFNFIITRAYSLLRKKKLATEHLATNKTILKGSFLFSIAAILNGFSLFFIAKTVYPQLGLEELLFVMSVGNLAGAAGMLAVFAPSGIGVRESIQLVLLSLIMPPELALLVTVITRVWGVAVDFLFFALTKLATYFIAPKR